MAFLPASYFVTTQAWPLSHFDPLAFCEECQFAAQIQNEGCQTLGCSNYDPYSGYGGGGVCLQNWLRPIKYKKRHRAEFRCKIFLGGKERSAKLRKSYLRALRDGVISPFAWY